jgi:hypothetical protein
VGSAAFGAPKKLGHQIDFLAIPLPDDIQHSRHIRCTASQE